MKNKIVPSYQSYTSSPLNIRLDPSFDVDNTTTKSDHFWSIICDGKSREIKSLLTNKDFQEWIKHVRIHGKIRDTYWSLWGYLLASNTQSANRIAKVLASHPDTRPENFNETGLECPDYTHKDGKFILNEEQMKFDLSALCIIRDFNLQVNPSKLEKSKNKSSDELFKKHTKVPTPKYCGRPEWTTEHLIGFLSQSCYNANLLDGNWVYSFGGPEEQKARYNQMDEAWTQFIARYSSKKSLINASSNGIGGSPAELALQGVLNFQLMRNNHSITSNFLENRYWRLWEKGVNNKESLKNVLLDTKFKSPVIDWWLTHSPKTTTFVIPDMLKIEKEIINMIEHPLFSLHTDRVVGKQDLHFITDNRTNHTPDEIKNAFKQLLRKSSVTKKSWSRFVKTCEEHNIDAGKLGITDNNGHQWTLVGYFLGRGSYGGAKSASVLVDSGISVNGPAWRTPDGVEHPLSHVATLFLAGLIPDYSYYSSVLNIDLKEKQHRMLAQKQQLLSKKLLEAIDWKAISTDNTSVLHIAASKLSAQTSHVLVPLLLKWGANPKQKNNNDETCIDTLYYRHDASNPRSGHQDLSIAWQTYIPIIENSIIEEELFKEKEPVKTKNKTRL